MLQIKDISVRLGERVLFTEASLTIFEGEKVGVVGRNGCGKTSLFKIILGELTLDQGNCQSNYQYPVHLEQANPTGHQLALEYVQTGDTLIFPLYQKLTEAERRHDYTTVTKIHNRLYELGGYDLENRAIKIMLGLGFNQDQILQPADELSGGWQRRLKLARVLASNAKLMLLDEPTNHLDLDAILWLIHWLKGYKNTLLIISHDRDFLDQTVGKIAHIQHQKINLYSGNYSAYERLKAERLQQEQRIYDKQRQTIAHLTQFIDRFRAKAAKAKQAQSRIKFLEKMALVEITRTEASFNFTFPVPPKVGNPLISAQAVTAGYPQKPILEKVDFYLGPKDSIGILGKNGEGKSTWLKTLTGNLPPLKGTIICHPQLKIGYFDQQAIDHLDLQLTPFLYFRDSLHAATESQIRSFLGGFGFNNQRVTQPLKIFSGGEKARLVLAKIIWQKPNLLVLDEPTNHLDLEMREALAYALQRYEGATILVAHDRYLLQTVDQFYLVRNHRLTPFVGTLEDYQQMLLS